VPSILERWRAGGLSESLRCPVCLLSVAELVDGDGFVCPVGHRMEFVDGYLEAGPAEGDELSQRTAASFGYEWTTFDDVRSEDEVFARWYLQDLQLDALGSKTGLDAGCGKGRFTRYLAPHLGVLVALDASAAISIATRDLGQFANVTTMRSDLRSAPFQDASFDFVSCLGVLHHLEDPYRGFQELVRLLRPGGTMLLYLYSRPSGYGIRWAGIEVARLLRTVTVNIDRRVLRWLSAGVAAVLQAVFVMPGRMGERWHLSSLTQLPLAVYRKRSFRALWLDTFDRLSAPVEHRYVWADLEPWFAGEELVVESVRDEAGFFIVAKRPISR
jgi:SAM-dependent methyltransferase